MPLRVRLVLAFLLPLVALGAVGLLALGQLEQATNMFARVANDYMTRLNYIEGLSTDLSQLRALELEHLIATDAQRRQQIGQQLSAHMASLQENLAAYEATLPEEDRLMVLPLLQQRYAAYGATHERLMALVAEGRQDEALALYRESEAAYESLLADTRTLHQQEAVAAQGAAHKGYTLGHRSRNILVGGLLAAVGLIFAIGLWFSGYVQRRLGSLIMVIRRVAQGDFSYTVEPRGNDEFATLARAFNAMTSSLRESEAENLRLHAQSLKLREERIALLQEALSRAVEAQENERQRISRELHDQAGQALVALQLGLSRLERVAPTTEIAQTASTLREMALETLTLVRNLALDLRPGMLDEAGLVPTLREYANAFCQRTGIPVEVVASDSEARLPPELEITIFRIVQEALTNVVKHARASHARVTLTRTASRLEVTVEDDGVGFDVEKAMKGQRRKSLGLFGMEERCRLSGGTLELRSQPGQGSRVICTWELPPATAGAAAEEGVSVPL